MKLIVGLGNPGKKYQGSRHNVGFDVIAELHRRFDSPRPAGKFNSELVAVRIGQQQMLLQSPLTYMNLSGQAVQAAMDFYKLNTTELLVVCDDFNLPVGKIRIRASGSGGGQNGLQDIINRLGTTGFARMRIGIGPVPPGFDPANWVLGRFLPDELTDIRPAIQRGADAAMVWVEQGVNVCMNRFNTVAQTPTNESKPESPSGRPGPGIKNPEEKPGER